VSLLWMNVLQAFVYSIQLSYIAKMFAGEHFGLYMSLSTLMQSAVNPLAILLSNNLDSSRLAKVPFYNLCTAPLLLLWAFLEQRRHQRSNAVHRRQLSGT